MDADVPVVPVAVVDDVLPTLGEGPVAHGAWKLHGARWWPSALAAFVAALVFVVPPIFFSQMASGLAA